MDKMMPKIEVDSFEEEDRALSINLINNPYTVINIKILEAITYHFDVNLLVYVTVNNCLVKTNVPLYFRTFCKPVEEVFEVENDTLYFRSTGPNGKLFKVNYCECDSHKSYFIRKPYAHCTYDVFRRKFLSENVKLRNIKGVHISNFQTKPSRIESKGKTIHSRSRTRKYTSLRQTACKKKRVSNKQFKNIRISRRPASCETLYREHRVLPIEVSVKNDRSCFHNPREEIIPKNSCIPTDDNQTQYKNDKFPTQATDGPHQNVEVYSTHASASTLQSRIPANSRPQSEIITCRYPDQKTISQRQQSFVHWPHPANIVDTEKMVECGLFYTGPFDLVRCYSCGLGMKDWAAGDDPLLEHLRFSPRCEHLETTVDPQVIRGYRTRVNSRNHQRIRHPHYESREARLASFKTWTNNGHQTPEGLVDAGFFYTGEADRTRCYHCDGGLQHWDEGDEPWIEHARWFPHCEHVRRVKGETFIEMVQAALRSLEDETEDAMAEELTTDMAALDMNGTGKESEDPIYNPMAQNVITLFGFSKAAVRMAIKECADNGRRWNTEILANILFDKQERGETLPVDSPRPSSPIETSYDINTDEGLMAEHKRLLSIIKCLLCENNEANILFLPCAHRRLCSECARDVTMCPICTKQIKEQVLTYMA